jgi:hypothetical protein
VSHWDIRPFFSVLWLVFILQMFSFAKKLTTVSRSQFMNSYFMLLPVARAKMHILLRLRPEP